MTSAETTTSFGLEAAHAIGRALCERAVRHGHLCTWTADELVPRSGRFRVVHRGVDASLYSGTAGIGVFLADLAAETDDKQVAATARGALLHARMHGTDRSLGFYDGSVGVAWALWRAGERLGDRAMAEDGVRRALELSARPIADDAEFDLVSGLAGQALAWIDMSAMDDRFEAAAEQAVARLLTSAMPSATGSSWPDASGHALTGAAHGASGIALALIEQFARTGQQELRDAAFEAFRFERSWYDVRRVAWVDAREGQPSLSPASSWCAGAAGIGLVRLRAFELTGDPLALAEATAAVQGADMELRRVRPASEGTNACVCHGDASLLELFLVAHGATGNPSLHRRAEALAHRMLAARERAGAWASGVRGGGEQPGAMLGIAGIGSAFLALSRPKTSRPWGLLPVDRSQPRRS